MTNVFKWAVGLGAAGLGLFWVSKSMAAGPGDKLQVGDDAFVRVGPGGVDPTALTDGQGHSLFPVQITQIVVHVTSLDGQTLQGPITAYVPVGAAQFVPLQTQVGPVQVERKNVQSVMRAGAVVATS